MRQTLIATVAALCIVVSTPAFAVDTPSEKTPPDLAAIRAKIKAKDFATARDDLFKLAATHEHADVYNLLGFTLRKTGDYKRALTYYQKALDWDENHLGAHEYIGELFVETGQLDKARHHLAILERLCPKGCEEREDLQKAIEAAAKTTK